MLFKDKANLEDGGESVLGWVQRLMAWSLSGSVQHCSVEAGGRIVYIAYQIWLFRNSLVFEA